MAAHPQGAPRHLCVQVMGATHLQRRSSGHATFCMDDGQQYLHIIHTLIP
jgi:hypothetical protein